MAGSSAAPEGREVAAAVDPMAAVVVQGEEVVQGGEGVREEGAAHYCRYLRHASPPPRPLLAVAQMRTSHVSACAEESALPVCGLQGRASPWVPPAPEGVSSLAPPQR